MKVIVPKEKYLALFFFDPFDGEYYLLTAVIKRMRELYGHFTHHECRAPDKVEWEQYINFDNEIDAIDFKLRFL